MKKNRVPSALLLVLLLAGASHAQTAPPAQPTHPAVHSRRPTVRNPPALCEACIQANLSYLAGPELRGRGSGTEDEHNAAEYLAAKLKEYGLAPAAGEGQYIQSVVVSEPDQGAVAPSDAATPQQVIRQTWNVLAKIEGATRKHQIILLSAHFDHLGVKDGKTYFGADDDASGCAAVLELARSLAQGPAPLRTVVVALWGGEEAGLVGSRYLLEHPAFPLNDIVVNLEFEMLGRPDPLLQSQLLWLSGWERTNLGPELVRHGANLAPDPHTAQKFFTRSDNFALAEDGIVAQTVSSFGVHADYHEPTDTVDRIDFEHLNQAIASMIAPVTWLVNSSFKPQWVEGQKP